MPDIRYYISGHGLGHASRSCQVINALTERHPHLSIDIVSDAHSWFFPAALDKKLPIRSQQLDIGVLQQDSLIMREEETLRSYQHIDDRREELLAQESRLLIEDRVKLVVGDIPPLAFAAAKRAGIDSVAITNFSWDWIYRGIAERVTGYDDLIDQISEDYQQASLLLRLPFSADTSMFPHVKDVPMIARKAKRGIEEMRCQLGVPEGKPMILLSFGGFGLSDVDFSPLTEAKDYFFVTEQHIAIKADNILILKRDRFYYPDLVHAADVVMTKPGYGIVSEAIANGTRVLYTSRGAFREEPLLVEALNRHTICDYVDNDALRSGRWVDALPALLARDDIPEPITANGADVIADRLAGMFS